MAKQTNIRRRGKAWVVSARVNGTQQWKSCRTRDEAELELARMIAQRARGETFVALPPKRDGGHSLASSMRNPLQLLTGAGSSETGANPDFGRLQRDRSGFRAPCAPSTPKTCRLGMGAPVINKSAATGANF